MGNPGATRQNLLLRSIGAIDRLFLLCCVLYLAALAHNHYHLVKYPLPLDYNEPIMSGITADFVAGDSPYSFASQPARMAVYPPLNNLIIAPLTLVFGNTLPLHRAVNGIFIVASCGLCFLMTYKASRSTQNSLAAALIFYAGLLYYSTPIAGPNGIGIFLFLLSLCIPWRFQFSNRSLAAALALGVMAFYAKQYFIASLGYIALYLFLAVSKQRAVIFGVLSALIFLVSLALMHYTSPYFIDDTITAGVAATAVFASSKAMLKQLLEYGQIYLPVLAILAILAILGGLAFWNRYDVAAAKVEQHNSPGSDKPALFNLKNLDAPLLGRKPDYIWLCFSCSLAVFVFSLGKNPANHLTYLFHLVSPFLLAGTLILVSKSMNLQWLYQLLLIWAFYTTYAILPRDFSVDQKNWDRLAQVVSQGARVYASPIVLGELVAGGTPIYYNGSTPYFGMTLDPPAFLQKKDPEKTVGRIWENYNNKIRAMIENQEFDLFVLDNWTVILAESFTASDTLDGKALLEKYYQRTEIINISLAKRPGGGKYAMEVWKPRVGPVPEIDATAP